MPLAERGLQDVGARGVRAELGAESGSSISVTLSLGIAALGAEHQTPGDLVSHADEAMYRAKQAGRNRVERAGPARR